MEDYFNPTLQTKYGTEGNCFAACVATLFPVNIDDVPTFEDGDYDWIDAISEWMGEKFGKYMVTVKFVEKGCTLLNNSLCIITALSEHPDVERHAMIARGDMVVFDPMIGEVNIPLSNFDDITYCIVGDIRGDNRWN